MCDILIQAYITNTGWEVYDMKQLPVAVQVYSVRGEAEKDFVKTMTELKNMGYDGVELAGLYGMQPAQIREILDTLDLRAISAHVPYEEFEKDMAGTITAYKTIGCEYVAIPWLSEERRLGGSKYEETITFIREIAQACKEQGIELLYHNHEFEFKKAEDGQYHLEHLFKDAGEEILLAQLDTCWVKVGGEDPAAYLNKYKGRCPLVHIKDFRKNESGVELVALGEGEQQLEALINSTVENGANWLVIEQDDHPYGTPMDNMKKSITVLHRIMK